MALAISPGIFRPYANTRLTSALAKPTFQQMAHLKKKRE